MNRPSPKTDARYWFSAVYRPRYGGKAVGHYSARVQHAGRREAFAFKSAGLNKAEAARQARDVYLFLLANGWDETLKRFKPRQAAPEPEALVTVGDLIRHARASASARPRTVEDGARCLRQVVADSFQIEAGTRKHDYRAGGRDAWAQKVEAVRLCDLTPARVRAWKQAFLARAKGDAQKQRSARISVNSILRQAKSLFSEHRLQGARLAADSPFDGVKFEPRQSMKYRSGFSIAELVRSALRELDPEALKAFLLAAMAGLRRNEIDKLPWSAFDWDRGTLHIEVTAHFEAKSQDSLGSVDLDPEFLALFQGFRAAARGEFVIESAVAPRLGVTYTHLRCRKVFTRLNAWLSAKGVPGDRPLHALRKEYGSQVNLRHGLFAASQALRHGDLAVTAAHYLDKKTRVTAGLGRLLHPEV